MDSCDHYVARVAAAASTTLAGHIPCTLVSVPDKDRRIKNGDIISFAKCDTRVVFCTSDQVKVVARARFERECLFG
jgi:hypothetical protein